MVPDPLCKAGDETGMIVELIDDPDIDCILKASVLGPVVTLVV